jgi:predicted NAD/FAD-binding protein
MTSTGGEACSYAPGTNPCCEDARRANLGRLDSPELGITDSPLEAIRVSRRHELKMRSQSRHIAVIGAGIAGLTAAYILQHRDDVTLFEADNRLGGHAHTHSVISSNGLSLSVDTGFIVCNAAKYPLLMRLFRELGIATQDTEMSMSVQCKGCGLEYAGAKGVRGLFARPISAVNPYFLIALGQIPAFYEHARSLLASSAKEPTQTFGEFLSSGHYTRYFVRHFAIPIASSIWSCGADQVVNYPAVYLFTFLENHGLLSPKKSSLWRTVTGGSNIYVERIASQLTAIRIATPVRAVHRCVDGIEVRDRGDNLYWFDAVVIATHADEALRILAYTTPLEREILGAFRYSKNEITLHTDITIMPRHINAWASWNYVMNACGELPSSVHTSYDLNKLQRLSARERYLVTLNGNSLVREDHVLAHMRYDHPIYTVQSLSAQRRLPALSHGRIAYAGAYHGWGFHEDGCRSGVNAARVLGVEW